VPSRFWYLVSVILILGGLALAIGPTVSVIMHRSPPVQFVAPGTKEINVVEPGTYTLWNDYEAIFQGRSYSTPSNSLPDGLHVKLRRKDTGANLEMRSSFGTYMRSGSTASRSIGCFALKQPSRYELSVTNPSSNPLLFSFGKDWLSSALLFGTGGLFIVCIGVIFWFIVLIKRS